MVKEINKILGFAGQSTVNAGPLNRPGIAGSGIKPSPAFRAAVRNGGGRLLATVLHIFQLVSYSIIFSHLFIMTLDRIGHILYPKRRDHQPFQRRGTF